MKITLSPMRGDTPLTLHHAQDVLTLNGESFDFSAIPDGATLPRLAVACDWLASDVERIEGELTLTLILPHGPTAAQGTRFPQPLVVRDDGLVMLPPYDIPEPEVSHHED